VHRHCRRRDWGLDRPPHQSGSSQGTTRAAHRAGVGTMPRRKAEEAPSAGLAGSRPMVRRETIEALATKINGHRAKGPSGIGGGRFPRPPSNHSAPALSVRHCPRGRRAAGRREDHNAWGGGARRARKHSLRTGSLRGVRRNARQKSVPEGRGRGADGLARRRRLPRPTQRLAAPRRRVKQRHKFFPLLHDHFKGWWNLSLSLEGDGAPLLLLWRRRVMAPRQRLGPTAPLCMPD
jgi:hypothetical protein